MNGEGRRPPAAVALEQLVHNPFNPREALTDLEETAASLRAKGQIQPVTVVRTAAFLAAHPGQEEAVGAAEYVVIDGNRRLAAAHQAHLAELRIDVNDDLAATAADILESALIANVHRVDVPPTGPGQSHPGTRPGPRLPRPGRQTPRQDAGVGLPAPGTAGTHPRAAGKSRDG